jgi:hypothetical protein
LSLSVFVSGVMGFFIELKPPKTKKYVGLAPPQWSGLFPDLEVTVVVSFAEGEKKTGQTRSLTLPEVAGSSRGWRDDRDLPGVTVPFRISISVVAMVMPILPMIYKYILF